MDIELSHNKISDQGAITLSTYLHPETLDLSYNNIRDKGAIGLAENASRLCDVDVSYNRIGKLGIERLRNSSISHLNIEGNIQNQNNVSLQNVHSYKEINARRNPYSRISKN